MTMFVAIPLQMITPPNYFTEITNDRWEITDPNSQDLWFQLSIDDNLGLRRYVPTAGSTITVDFQRSDEFRTEGVQINRLQSQARTISKTASVNSDDRSLWKVSLTSQDAQTILSGTVKFTLTESGTSTVWVQNFFVYKNITDPGF